MRSELLKCVEFDGFKVELLLEGKGLYRLNVKDAEGFERTRIFTDYAEADALFRSYLTGQ